MPSPSSAPPPDGPSGELSAPSTASPIAPGSGGGTGTAATQAQTDPTGPSDGSPADQGPEPDGGRTPLIGRRLSRRERDQLTLGISLAAGFLAAFAPATLTGNTAIDVLERMVLAGIVTFVGAHAHRWTWFVAGILVAIPARGFSLVLVFFGLLSASLFTRTRRRSRPAGAVAVGCFANAALWYPAEVLPTGASHVVAVAAFLFLLIAGYGEVSRRHRRVVTAILGVILFVLLAGLVVTGYVAFSARDEFRQGTASARQALQAVRAGDSDEAQNDLATAQLQLASASERLDGPLTLPMRFVPGLAQQVDAVEISVDEALAVSQAASDLIDTDYDQLRYEGQIDLGQVTALVPQSRAVRDRLATAERRLTDLESRTLLPPLRSRVEEFSNQVVEAHEDAELAADLLEVAPAMLGADGDRHYLVVFMTPAELRGAGGFVGNFVELSAIDGDVDLARSGRITELIDAAPPGTRTLDGPPDYVARYGPLELEDNLQDVTVSPNWPSDASAYAQLYPQSGGREVDGVIGIDPTGLAGLLELTGPVPVPGFPGLVLNADNAVEALTTQQYLLFTDEERREDFLEAAIRATFEQLTEASLPAPSAIGDALGDVVRGRHVQLWSPTTAEQTLFEELGADGELSVPAGQDGLAVVQQNVGNNKIDAYLERTVSYRAAIDPSDATIEATVTIELTNAVPTINLPPIVVGNNRGVPVGTNLTSLAVFTPHVVTSATVDGASVKLSPDTEVGLRVWDVPLISIPPGRTVEIVLELEGALDLSSAYTFQYLPQPQANPEEFDADIRLRAGTFTDANGSRGLRATGPVEAPVVLESELDP